MANSEDGDFNNSFYKSQLIGLTIDNFFENAEKCTGGMAEPNPDSEKSKYNEKSQINNHYADYKLMDAELSKNLNAFEAKKGSASQPTSSQLPSNSTANVVAQQTKNKKKGKNRFPVKKPTSSQLPSNSTTNVVAQQTKNKKKGKNRFPVKKPTSSQLPSDSTANAVVQQTKNKEKGKDRFSVKMDVYEKPDQDYEIYAENVHNRDEESGMLSDEDIDRLIQDFSDDTCEDSSEDEDKSPKKLKKNVPIVRSEMKPSAPSRLPDFEAAQRKKREALKKFDKRRKVKIQHGRGLFKEINGIKKSTKGSHLNDIERMHIDNLKAELSAVNEDLVALEKLRRSFETCTSLLLKRLQEAVGAEELDQAWQYNLNLKLEFKFLDNAFPIYHVRDEVIQTIKKHQALVVLAETGSGKSTQLTQFLMQAGYGDDKLIACTEPRKVAATSLASHISSEIGSRVGHQVGFYVGYQRRYMKNRTKVVYTTNYTLLREIVKDPELKAYGVVIVDEAHERSIGTDLLLGMLKQCLKKRPDLKVIITSATINPTVFVDYFGGVSNCPVIKAGGRTYPVDIIWGDSNQYPDPNSNYAQEAVDLAFSLHMKSEPGDILVFLTSPYEIEEAAAKLEEKDQKNELQINQLHGKLQSEEQSKVFEKTPQGKRKIVLSTIVGETSITIPVIKYVIDCGLIKESIFDAKRNINKVEVRLVSKSSADQRKGRAGRVSPGKCYRLYCKDAYASMRDGSLPEILRVHLDHSLLRLLQLGVKNPFKFDFVEGPEPEALLTAMTKLIRLGAVVQDNDEYQLTILGEYLAKLPVEPALGKLILLSIDEGIGYEGILLAAVSTNQGSVFYRAGTDEEKAKSDMTRVNFCLPEGDIITAMKVYMDWLNIDKKQRHRWCMDNNIHTKAVKTTQSTIKDISSILSKDIGVEFLEEYLVLSPNQLWKRLQPLLLECFPENLSVFTGHHRLGYMLVESPDQFATLHMSSALRYLGDLAPKFLLHGQIMTTWRDCLVDVTPIDDDVVEKAKENGIIKYDPNDVMTVVKYDRLGPYSDQILRTSLNNYIKRKEEERIKEDLQCKFVVIDTDLDNGFVYFYLPEDYHLQMNCHVKQILLKLERKKKAMKNKVAYYSLETAKGAVVSRAAVTAGVEVFEVLNQGEFIEVLATRTERHLSDQEIENTFRKYGDLLSTYFYNDGKHQGIAAVFRNSKEARQCVQKINNGLSMDDIFRVIPLFKPQNKDENNENDHCHISLYFHGSFGDFESQPAIKCRIHRGYGFISCQSLDDADSVIRFLGENIGQLKKITQKGKPLRFSKSKKRRTDVFIGNIHSNVTETEVSACITLLLQNVNITVKRVFLIHERNQFNNNTAEYASRTSPEEKLAEMLKKSQIYGAIISQTDQNGNSQTISRELKGAEENNNSASGNGSDDWHLKVTFDSFESGAFALESLKNNRNRLSGILFEATVVSSMFCSKGIFKNIRASLKKFEVKLREAAANHGQSSLNVKEEKSRVTIEVHTENLELNSTIRYLIDQELMRGQREDFSGRQVGQCLFTSAGLTFLEKLGGDTKTTILPDATSLSITLYGSEEDRCNAIEKINRYLEKLEEKGDIMMFEKDIKKPGLLKQLVTTYGIDFQKLIDQTNVIKMYADIRSQRLAAYCTKQQFEEVCHLVDEVSKALPGNAAPDDERQIDRECPVCLCEVEGVGYRLQGCMHVYCQLCIRTQLQNDNTIPLTCCYQDCDEPIVFYDIERLIPRDSALAAKLIKESVKTLMGKRTDKYFPCPSADCRMIFKKDDLRKETCPICSNNVCLNCMVVYHEGVECEEYRIYSDDKLREWLQADPKNRKKCGNCSTIVEKISGCNRMQCTRCKCIFCWLCLKVFSSDAEIYNHLETCRMNRMLFD